MMGGPSTTLCLGFILSLMVMAQCLSTTPADQTTTIEPEPKSSEATGSPSGGPTQPSPGTTTAPPPTDLTTLLPPTVATQPSSASQTGGAPSSAAVLTAKTTIAAPEDCGGIVCGLNQGCVLSEDGVNKTCQCLPNYVEVIDNVCIDPCNPECSLNEVCNPTDGVMGYECQCQDGYVRNKTGTCQDPSQATCDTVNCGVPEQCVPNANGTFSHCNCTEFQILKEGICIDDSRPTCEAITFDGCQDLSYNLTQFPNPIYEKQANASEILGYMFPALDQVGCSAEFFEYLCLVFVPPCPSSGTPTIPCREFCESSVVPCIKLANASGIPVPVGEENCTPLPPASSGMCFEGTPTPTIPSQDTPTTTAPASLSKASTAQPPRDPTTGPPVVPPSSTVQPSRDPTTGPPVVPTKPAVETSEPVAVPTKPAAVTSKPATKVSTAAPGKGFTTVQPGQGTQPVHASYKGPLIGLFIFLLITTAVFIAIYMVRKRKLRNNYGRLDEDSSEGGWSAFSKNPIYRGDRDYQPL